MIGNSLILLAVVGTKMELQTRDAAAIMECSGMAGQKDELHRFRWRSDSIYDRMEEEIGTIQRRITYETKGRL